DEIAPHILRAAAKPGTASLVGVRFSEPIPVDTLASPQFRLNETTPVRIHKPQLKYSSEIVLEFPDLVAGVVVARGISDAAKNTTVESRVRLHLQPAKESIVINELLYEPLVDEFDGIPDQPEFIEIRSLSGEPQVLGDCVLSGRSNENGARDLLNFETDNAVLSPHGLAVIVSGDDASLLRRAFPELPADASIATILESSLRLTNEGGRVALECPDAGIIDVVVYTPEWHEDSMPSTRGRSLERIDATAASSRATNWTTSRALTGATPAFENSVTPSQPASPASLGDIAITEVMFEPRSDDQSFQFEYIELYNLSEKRIDLNGFYATDSGAGSDSTGIRIWYDPAVLAPDQYGLVISNPFDDTDDDIVTRAFPSFTDSAALTSTLRRRRFTLPNQGGEIALHNPEGVLIDRVVYSSDWHHPHLAESRGISLERISETLSGTLPSNWTSSVHLEGGTPGLPNSVRSSPAPGRRSLEISPSPFLPDRDGDRDHTTIRYRFKAVRPFVQATIFDSRGRPVRRLSTGTISSSDGSLIWDGFDDAGALVRSGIYVIYLRATDVVSNSTEELRGVVVAARIK
ncbi:MAG: hypothetical protein HKN13_10060, partial [Rhodothermales bacterium]|nr:hypothetical protein [Rhodothermales bacterium]